MPNPILTHNIGATHKSGTQSKWNLDEILGFNGACILCTITTAQMWNLQVFHPVNSLQ